MPRTTLVLLCLFSLCLTAPILAQGSDEAPPPEGEAPIAVSAPTAPAAPSVTIEDLQRQIEQLREEIAKLKASRQNAPAPAEAPVPSEAPAPEETPAPAPAPAPGGGATFLPDISAIGNVVGRFSNKPEPDRNKLLLDELEIGIQSNPYPKMHVDAFLSAEQPGFQLELEEGILTLQQLGNTPFSAKLGKMRTPFGKLNPRHPHQWPFVDQPAVMTAFLGEDGLNTNGADLLYLLPTGSKLFANLEVGRWDVSSDSPFSNTLTTSRLWTSKALGDLAEAELGASYAIGREAPDGIGRRNPLHLMGVDFTYRSWPDVYKRWLLMAEWMRQTRSLADGSGSAQGYYGLLEYQLNRYWKAGLRYDWTQFPFPSTDTANGISAILTNQLSEGTFLRLQLTHGKDAEFGNINRALLQFVYGIGPHTHPLQ